MEKSWNIFEEFIIKLTAAKVTITLIEKKDYDKRLFKNWRPVSLRNAGIKIISKSSACRIEEVMYFVAKCDQTTLVEGGNIRGYFSSCR